MTDSNIQNTIRIPPKWIELNISKRECSVFLAEPGDDTLCQCGRRKIDHGEFVKYQHRSKQWVPSIHSRVFSTDAYGTILFEGEHHPNKAHYTRLAYDTNPELIVQMMKFVWGHEMPKLVISIRGGSANFELSARLGKLFQAGLIKVAKTTSAWVLSSGLNTGVTKHLGTALNNERWMGGPKRGRIVSIGVAPWGMIEQRNDLIGRNKERVYSPLEHAGSKFLHLNPRHSNFLLVDNGSVGKFGGENYLRRKLEKCISTYPASPDRGCDTPVVVVVLEGGRNTLNMIHEYLHDDPPIPVVIFAGTGKCADIVAWMVKKFTKDYELNDAREEIIKKIAHSFHVGHQQCVQLYHTLKAIFRKKNLISVYNPNATSEDEEFDAVILASIFRSQHWSPLQQLSLALVWDRVDLAQAEVFVYGREWSRDNLEHAMMEALVSNRLDFVNLLLEHGLNMQQFLTASRLEALYSSKRIHSKLIETILTELSQIRTSSKKKEPHEKNLTLHDVGVALSHMMGHVYRSSYIHLVAKSHDAKDGAVDEQEIRSQTFAQPFDDLFVWAIVTKRHELGKILWVHGRGALAKALVAVKLNKYLIKELRASEKTTTNLVVEFENNAEEWENISLSLLDSCYHQDSKMARQLLTMELDNWSKQTCLMLAVMAHHRMLLGHPACQILLADLWMGALNIKTNSSLKIALGILFPPLALLWDYKSREELKLLPHQEKSSILHHHNPAQNGITSDLLNPPTDNQVCSNNLGVATLDTTTLRTYDAAKSRGSINSIFGNHPSHNFERTTDLAEVVKKLNISSTPTTTAFLAETGITSEPILLGEVHRRRHHLVKLVERPPHVVNDFANPEVSTLATGSSLPDDQPFRFKVVNNVDHHSSFVTTQQSLTAWRKLLEFHGAPITNFFRHAIAYIIFIVALAYVILYPQNPSSVGWMEIYVIACFLTQGLECIREFIDIDALSISQKFSKMGESIWQFGDFLVVIVCLIGTTLRLLDGFFDYGMVILRTSSIYWNLRLYKFLGVHRFVGPKIVMMSRMFSHMACFSMIIFVVIISFSVARESIRFPDVTPTFKDLAEGFLEPYIMMFGEVDLDALSPRCSDTEDDDHATCPLGYWLIPLFWVVYMMVSNVLIVNVLIAVFNRIYSEVDAMALEVWMFQRFNFVMEFENKPTLPPPFIIICHTISLLKYVSAKFIQCICEEELLEGNLDEDENPHIIMGNDHSLKSFLASNEQHIVFDFEEENVDVIRSVILREQAGSLGNGEMLANRLGIVSEKLSIQQLKFGLQELYGEMEEQRTKLDKLTAYWEMDIANQSADNDENFDESENISTHESFRSVHQ